MLGPEFPMETPPPGSSSPPCTAPSPFRPSLIAAIRYWEPRRLGYNAVLSVVAITWILATWPHFRRAFTLNSLPPRLVLALLANLCYCAAYFVDLPLQMSTFAARWQRSRWGLWVLGTLFAVMLEWYWIGDEIYPDFD
jgi:hypothetical protein